MHYNCYIMLYLHLIMPRASKKSTQEVVRGLKLWGFSDPIPAFTSSKPPPIARIAVPGIRSPGGLPRTSFPGPARTPCHDAALKGKPNAINCSQGLTSIMAGKYHPQMVAWNGSLPHYANANHGAGICTNISPNNLSPSHFCFCIYQHHGSHMGVLSTNTIENGHL